MFAVTELSHKANKINRQTIARYKKECEKKQGQHLKNCFGNLLQSEQMFFIGKFRDVTPVDDNSP